METIAFVAYILVLIILAKLLLNNSGCGCNGSEGLTARPADGRRETMSSQVAQNKHMFQNDEMDVHQIRGVFPWMDAVVFEDLRKLVRENKFDKQNIYKTLG